MRLPSPSSRTGRRVSITLWDLFWALITPPLALYRRDVDLLSPANLNVVGYSCFLSTAFSLLAFFALRIQDGMTRHFSVHEALDILEAVVFAELMTCGVLFAITRF